MPWLAITGAVVFACLLLACSLCMVVISYLARGKIVNLTAELTERTERIGRLDTRVEDLEGILHRITVKKMEENVTKLKEQVTKIGGNVTILEGNLTYEHKR